MLRHSRHAAALLIAARLTSPGKALAEGPSCEQGLASYYGADLDSRSTASGETFDMHGMTAAHRTLPFGTRVRVTNLGNGRSAVVRINDRGPFRKGRVVDVSYAAARCLRLVGPGVARVRLEVLPRVRRTVAAHDPPEIPALARRQRVHAAVARFDCGVHRSPSVLEARHPLNRHFLRPSPDL